jgi:hypothetical protein
MKMYLGFFLAVCLCFGQMCGEPTTPDNTGTTDDSGSVIPSGDNNGQDGTAGTPEPFTTPQTIDGPGFSVTIPVGFSSIADPVVPFPATFLDAYADQSRAILVATQKLSGGGQSQFEGLSFRVQSAQITDTGDFLLIAQVVSDDYTMLDALAAYGLLANGQLLCIELDSPTTTASDQLIGFNVFRSIDLEGTDGYTLQERWQASQPKILDQTAQGIVILDDLTAWELPYEPTPEASREFAAWQVGDAVHSQSYGSTYLEQYELVHVGRWIPIEVGYLGLAVNTSIASLDFEYDKIDLANGDRLYVYPYNIPSNWAPQDDVFVVDDGISQTVINRTTGQAITF